MKSSPSTMFQRTLILAAFSAAFPSVISRDCESGWLHFESSCYYFSDGSSNWHESRMICKAMKSDLVEVHSDKEYTFLRNYVRGHDTWVGLSDLEVEGTFRWVNGTIHDRIGSWWDDGEPNGNGEDERLCIHFKTSEEDRWNDERCTDRMRYICERPFDG